MDEDDLELARSLFSKATAMLEDAIEVAVEGQSARLDAAQLCAVAQRLLAASHRIEAIARAAGTVAGEDAGSG